jgi:hypothetical protein
MALGLAARFPSLTEADIACAALNAAGLYAVVFDRGVCATIWTHQLAVGGVRLMTFDAHIEDARALLKAASTAPRGSDDDLPAPKQGGGALIAALGAILCFGISPYAGWCVVPLRSKATVLRVLVVIGLLAFAAALWVPFLAASWGGDPNSG